MMNTVLHTSMSSSDNRRLLIGVVVAMGLVFVATLKGESEQIMTLEQLPSTVVRNVAAFDSCGAEPIVVPTLKDGEPVPKPFWVSSYPSSGSNLIGSIVKGLTGGSRGAHKSYYAKTKGMKKCFGGGTTTVTCEQIHPIVGIGPTPTQQAHKFQSKILLAIRNPLTVTPQSFQDKANRYHHANGTQVPLQAWRSFRDEWFEKGVVKGWENVTTQWHDMQGYEGIGLYMPFEHLMDTEKGPVLALQLAQLLRDAGFSVAQDKDVPCVWYRAVEPHLVENKHPLYEYAADYVPAFTAPQKKRLVQRLDDLMAKYPDDQPLQDIMQEYKTSVQTDPINDKPWKNETLKGKGGRVRA